MNIIDRADLFDLLRTHGFKETSMDDRHVQFESRYDGNSLKIYIIVNLPNLFLSIKLNEKRIYQSMPNSYHDLKKSIENFLDTHFKEV